MENTKTGAELIAAERQRQIDKEGWTPEHDDTHDRGELAREAALFALQDTPWTCHQDGMCGTEASRQAKSRVRLLEIAGALCAAEIDRLQRREGKCGAIGTTRDGLLTAVCQQPRGHTGKHAGMGCEWNEAACLPQQNKNVVGGA